MVEPSCEESPLLGGFPSPSKTVSQPVSPTSPPLCTSSLQVPSLLGAKIPKSQTSMDSGCESDAGEGDPLHPGGEEAFRSLDPSHTTGLRPLKVFHNSLSEISIECREQQPCTSNFASSSPKTRASPVSPNPGDAGISSVMSSPCLSSCTCSKVGEISSECQYDTPYNPHDSSSPCRLDRPCGRTTSCRDPAPACHEASFCNTTLCSHGASISCHDSSCQVSIQCSGTHNKAVVPASTLSNNEDVASLHASTSSAPQHVQTEEISAKVTFRIEGDEGEEENSAETRYLSPSRPVEVLSSALPRMPSYTKPSFLSSSSSTTSMPFCRICHLPEGDGVEALISPCRCSGTMEFIHHGCLMKWLEVSGSRSRQMPACELCNYQFHRRKKFRLRQCQMPSCSRLDRILHSIFLVCVVVMVACSTITVVCFKQNSNPTIKGPDTELTNPEVVTLTCGVLFFVAFFLAMYVEVKATDTLYRLCSSFFYINQTMHIYEYDRKRDAQYCSVSTANAPV